MATLRLTKSTHVIPDGLFGLNMEITRKTSFGGLSAELLNNRKFYAVDGETRAPKGWQLEGGETVTDRPEESLCCSNFVRLYEGGTLAGTEPVYCAPGRCYRLRVWASAAEGADARIRIDAGGSVAELCVARKKVSGDADGLTVEFVAARPDNEPQPLVVNCVRGSVYIYELSLMPADNYYGMRPDVIALLRELKPAYLRFPGGCCTDHFDWKEGLKPACERHPLDGSAKWFLFRDTFDQDTYELGINEFMLLCKAVGAEPEYTVRVVLSEPAEAAELVEYCNGGPETHWGGVREALGFKPFGLRRWYVGNEVYYFGYEYMNDGVKAARRCDEYARAMRAVDPDAYLIGGVCGDFHHDQWDRDMFAASETFYDEISFHGYCGTAIDDEKQDIESREIISKIFTGGVNPRLDWVKREIFANCWDKVRINVDEWNLTWGQYGSTLMLLADALTLHFFMKSFDKYHVTQARFFHPINEGMIRVTPTEARLDCVGVLMQYMNLHRGGRFIEAELDAPELDVVATEHSDGKRVISVVNRSAGDISLQLDNVRSVDTDAVRVIRLVTPSCSAFEDRVTSEEELCETDMVSVRPYETLFLIVGRK